MLLRFLSVPPTERLTVNSGARFPLARAHATRRPARPTEMNRFPHGRRGGDASQPPAILRGTCGKCIHWRVKEVIPGGRYRQPFISMLVPAKEEEERDEGSQRRPPTGAWEASREKPDTPQIGKSNPTFFIIIIIVSIRGTAQVLLISLYG